MASVGNSGEVENIGVCVVTVVTETGAGVAKVVNIGAKILWLCVLVVG